MNMTERRRQVWEAMHPQSALILFSGTGIHVSTDEYAAFEANRNFFYLTGLRRPNMILIMTKTGGEPKATLFIEKADPNLVRWTGKRITVEEAKETSQVDEVLFLDAFEVRINRLMGSGIIENLYFDCNRCQWGDLPDYNAVKAGEFAGKYPGVQIRDVFPIAARLRMRKGPEEIEKIKEAIRVTDESLKNVMRNLQPGRKEYQAQADFEYMVRFLGADGMAFPTIAGSGANGTMLHYGTNRDTCRDGDLLLLDLGAKYQGYCADITRTYPVNGKYSPRQRQVYDIVLKANRTIAATAKAGMRLNDLQQLCKQVLAEGCMELGLIQEPSEIGKYYMHGVSHHLGIDVHDVNVERDAPLPAGAVISDEPGLYIDEWGIGIRIEDDLFITENGCEVLSEGVMRDADEIETFMSEQVRK